MKQTDDFNFGNYTPCYESEHWQNLRNGDDYFINDKDLRFVDDSTVWIGINLNRNIKQLIQHIHQHRNHIKTVYECGAGACWNMRNVMKAFPHLTVDGSDYSQDQIDFGRRWFAHFGDKLDPTLHDRVRVIDWCQPDAWKLVGQQYDLVYCQAVIMHLEDSKAIEFIKNMMALSKRYIHMGENFAWNDFPDLLQRSGCDKEFSITTSQGHSDSCLWLERLPKEA